MTKKCDITGKSTSVTGSYSNRVRATKFNPSPKKRKRANMVGMKTLVLDTGEKIRLHLSAKGWRTLKKRKSEGGVKNGAE